MSETSTENTGNNVGGDAVFGWYISFVVQKIYCHKLILEHPALWVLRASRKYTDGPYIILSALPLTKKQYEAAQDEIA